MRVRVIDLVNSFYKDKQEDDGGQELAEYCCLGYFDALGVKLIPFDRKKIENLRKEVNQNVMQNLDGKCNRKSIVCVTDDDKKDEEFWTSVKEMPFLFVSLIRIKCNRTNDNGEQGNLQKIVEKLNKKEEVMAYYTYDHSDIVVFKYGKQYLKDLQSVFSMYHEINVFKMYSVFAIKEVALENCEAITDERINCRLNAVVKNMGKVNEYIKKLQEFLNKDNISGAVEIKCFDTLGNSDLLIEISNVSIRQLLCCYKMKNLLTHTNPDYEQAFFNVESQMFNVEPWNLEESMRTGNV